FIHRFVILHGHVLVPEDRGRDGSVTGFPRRSRIPRHLLFNREKGGQNHQRGTQATDQDQPSEGVYPFSPLFATSPHFLNPIKQPSEHRNPSLRKHLPMSHAPVRLTIPIVAADIWRPERRPDPAPGTVGNPASREPADPDR